MKDLVKERNPCRDLGKLTSCMKGLNDTRTHGLAIFLGFPATDDLLKIYVLRGFVLL